MASPRVTLRQGTFIGTSLHSPRSSSPAPHILDVFLGIPFALAPSGERRFRPPVAVSASTSTFDATRWGQRPPSSTMVGDEVPQGEDCLNANIFRPRARDGAKNEKLPVLVYFNGGAFNFGYAKSRLISSFVAWSEEPIIGVSFNYRVGALGFLPCKLMAKEGLLNLGLKDQSMLLEWVRENIGAFGGDPDNVTLMGTSAGAHSIGHHLMNNTGNPPPFHKVIMESGAPTARSVFPHTHPLIEQQFKDFLTILKCAGKPESEILPHLRSLPFASIRNASEAIFMRYNPSVRWPFQPVIDGPGGMIPRAPIAAWKEGIWHRVPILTGFNTNEGAMFVPAATATTQEFKKFFRVLLPLSETDLEKLETVYPDPLSDPSSPYVETRARAGKQYRRIEAAYAQYAYIAPVRQTAELASALPPSAPAQPPPSPPPVYTYHFDVSSSPMSGCNHGDQAGYVDHDGTLVAASPTLAAIAGTMHAYWSSFVVTGDPNTIRGRWPDRPRWEEYAARGRPNGSNGEKGSEVERGTGRIMNLGHGNDEMAGGKQTGIVAAMGGDGWARAECEFWWARTHLFEQDVVPASDFQL